MQNFKSIGSMCICIRRPVLVRGMCLRNMVGCHSLYLLHWVASDSESWDSVSQFQTRQLHSVRCLGLRLGRIWSLNCTGCCHFAAAVPCSLSLPLDRIILCYFSKNSVVSARLLANHFCSKKLHLFQLISVFFAAHLKPVNNNNNNKGQMVLRQCWLMCQLLNKNM